MDIINLSREASKLRRFFEVFQHAEEVLKEQAVADEKLRGIRTEQAKAETELEQNKDQGKKILSQATEEQRRILEKAEEERATIIAKAEKERESVLAVMGKDKTKLLAEIDALSLKLSANKDHVAQETAKLLTESASAQSKHNALIEGLKDKERIAQEATRVAEGKLQLAKEALANLKANL